MTGIEVKEKLKSEGVNLAELAKLLGYDNDQRLHSALKARDVKSGLLEDIARVANKSVCWFYEDGQKTYGTNSPILSGNNTFKGSTSVGGNLIHLELPKSGYQKIIKSDGTEVTVEAASPLSNTGGELEVDKLRKEVDTLKNKIIELQSKLLEGK